MKRLWLPLIAALLAFPLLTGTARADDGDGAESAAIDQIVSDDADGGSVGSIDLPILVEEVAQIGKGGPAPQQGGKGGPAPRQRPGGPGPAPQQMPGKGGAASTTTGGTAAIPPGWMPYEDRASGFALALPPDWETANRSALIEAGISPGAEVKLVATSRAGDAAALMFVAPLDEDISLDEATAGILSALQSDSSVSNITHQRTQLPAGPVEEFRLTLQTRSGQTYTTRLYVGLANGQIHLLMLLAEPARAAAYSATFDQIARGLRPA